MIHSAKSLGIFSSLQSALDFQRAAPSKDGFSIGVEDRFNGKWEVVSYPSSNEMRLRAWQDNA